MPLYLLTMFAKDERADRHGQGRYRRHGQGPGARERAARARKRRGAGLTNTAFLTSGTGREQIFDGIPEAV